jgi:hypothetical protein
MQSILVELYRQMSIDLETNKDFPTSRGSHGPTHMSGSTTATLGEDQQHVCSIRVVLGS